MPSAPPNSMDTTSMAFELPKVLIVEDDEDAGAIVATMLELMGMAPKLVQDAEKALVELVYRTPDVILLDINLPRLSGEDLVRILPALEHVSRVPIVVMSAAFAPGSEVVRSLKKLGVKTFLPKPFNRQQLRDAMLEAGVSLGTEN